MGRNHSWFESLIATLFEATRDRLFWPSFPYLQTLTEVPMLCTNENTINNVNDTIRRMVNYIIFRNDLFSIGGKLHYINSV